MYHFLNIISVFKEENVVKKRGKSAVVANKKYSIKINSQKQFGVATIHVFKCII